MFLRFFREILSTGSGANDSGYSDQCGGGDHGDTGGGNGDGVDKANGNGDCDGDGDNDNNRKSSVHFKSV